MKRVLWGLLAVGMFSMIMSCSDTSTGTGTSNESFGHLKMKITQVDPDYYDVHGVLVRVFPETLPEDQKDCLNSSTSIELYEDLTWIPQPISDAIFVLASGLYKVCSIPIKNSYTMTPSDICGVAVKRKVEVVSEYVTEVTLESLCNANGGLDVITTFKDEPLIIGLTIDHPPGKFITTCESATIHVIVDPNNPNVPFTYKWTFAPSLPPPQYSAKIQPDNAADVVFSTNWVPTPPFQDSYNDPVYLLTVVVTDSLGNQASMTFPIHVRECHPIYLGGAFTTANGGIDRYYAAAVDPNFGVVTDWNPILDDTVNALLISDEKVYLGGGFTSVNNPPQTALRAAVVDDIFGTKILGTCDPGIMNTVNTLGIHMVGDASNYIYIGGEFASIQNGGTPRDHAAAFGTDLCSATIWNPPPGGIVNALAFSGNTVYIGGLFTPSYAIAVKDSDGILLPAWTPPHTGGVNTLEVTDDSVYLGGLFITSSGGNTYNYAEAVDKTNGSLIATWDPLSSVISTGGNVKTLAVVGSIVYLGGAFKSHTGNNEHDYLAAFDTNTGAVIDTWTPDVKAPVNTLAVCGSTVYFGGEFVQVGTTTRHYAAAVEAVDVVNSTGALTSWNPDLSAPVHTLTMECP